MLSMRHFPVMLALALAAPLLCAPARAADPPPAAPDYEGRMEYVLQDSAMVLTGAGCCGDMLYYGNSQGVLRRVADRGQPRRRAQGDGEVWLAL